jgi:predicted lipid-binding transport protein (Tim44 family)
MSAGVGLSATLVASIVLFLLLLLVAVGVVLLLVGAAVVMMRSRSAPAAPPAPVPDRRPRAAPPPSAPPPATPAARPAPSASPSTAGSGGPPALGSGLLGFFDDEPSTQRTGEVEGAKTELFQRGKMAIDWDDDEDEGEATEIFSAHGAAGDLAEFAFDDDEQSTGRFPD